MLSSFESEILIAEFRTAAVASKWKRVNRLLDQLIIHDLLLRRHLNQVLVLAIKADQSALVERLINLGAKVNKVFTPDKGFFGLHLAVENENYKITKFLLESKANPSIKSRPVTSHLESITPLELAVHKSQGDLVNLLLKRGADPHIQNSKNQTPIEQAAQMKHWHIVLNFLQFPYDKDPRVLSSVLGQAIAQDKFEYVKLLLEAGAKTDIVCFKALGYFPLHVAVAFGNAKACKYLLEAKADPCLQTQSPSPKTPLRIAIELGKKELYDFFEDKIINADAIISQHAEQPNIVAIGLTLEKLSKSHKPLTIIALVLAIKDEYLKDCFCLALIFLLFKIEEKRHLTIIENFALLYENIAPEADIFMTRALIMAFDKAFRNDQQLSELTRDTLKKLSANRLHAKFEKKLLILAFKFCNEIQSGFYSKTISKHFKNVIVQLAVIEFLNESHKTPLLNIRETVEFLFGKNVLKHGWFRRNELADCIDDMLFKIEIEETSFSLSSSTKIHQQLTIKPTLLKPTVTKSASLIPLSPTTIQARPTYTTSIKLRC